tara:strand:- start:250 stop:915 length:666 start_codon:yes stop_codon:yes gene_type:complete
MKNEKFTPEDNYLKKIKNFIFEYEKNNKNLNILEFGVREGRSTKIFLDICRENGGKLLSVDIDDYSNLFKDENWTFLKSRDDDYKKVSNLFTEKFDIILIDSLHEPNHVAKLIYLYWQHLNVRGSMYIDDISWLPYIEGSWRDHEYTENINRNTFFKILEIQNSNFNSMDLTFNFNGSGMCRIIKVSDDNLIKYKIIKNRNMLFKNNIKKLLHKLKIFKRG